VPTFSKKQKKRKKEKEKEQIAFYFMLGKKGKYLWKQR
jgi:hypothetical protein